MSIINSAPKYTLTEGHQQLGQLLGELGFIVDDERSFGPYTVDCYVRVLHVAFEYDGAYHSSAHDYKRDQYLFAEHGLPVIRVTEMDPEKMLWEMCHQLLLIWEDSAEIRRNS